ncbi:MAG: hypothetical protein JSS68_01755 [Actinobacteria bacterium]|nr:hypothetical protein [Actinomycetota bacterium]
MAGNEYVTADGSVWNEAQRWLDRDEWGIYTLERLEIMAAQPPADERGWSASDATTLHVALSLEGDLRFFGLPNSGSDEVVDGLYDFVDRWHGALPFDEQERVAVYKLHLKSRDNAPPPKTDVPTLPELLQTTELELMTNGVRRAVRGRDLLQRWSEWRHGVGEFEGQDGYQEAMKALALMTARLVPPSVLPAAYYEVMGLEPPADT